MTEPLFETERLLVRPWLPGDLDSIHAIYSDPLAMRWVGDGTPLDRDRCREWISVTAANHRSRGYGMCAIVDRADGRIVGSGGLVHPDGRRDAEIKYAFLRTHWRRGLASEFVPAMLAHGRDAHGMTRILSTVACAHSVSRLVLERSGLHRIGERVEKDGTTTCVYMIEFKRSIDDSLERQ